MKRRSTARVRKESRPWATGPVAWIKKTEIPAIADRAARFMEKGGASLDEMREVYQLVMSFQFQEKILDLLSEADRLARSRRRQVAAFERIIAGKEVGDAERAAIRKLNDDLTPKIPKKTVRYREIAKRLSTRGNELRVDRVRYVIEGPRRGRPENRGQRKRLSGD